EVVRCICIFNETFLRSRFPPESRETIVIKDAVLMLGFIPSAVLYAKYQIPFVIDVPCLTMNDRCFRIRDVELLRFTQPVQKIIKLSSLFPTLIRGRQRPASGTATAFVQIRDGIAVWTS